MRRIYKAREFWEVSTKIERQWPDTFVGLDVIVGFPGETDAEFKETLRCLERTFWSKLHVFSFSARQGTRAAGMEGKVPGPVIAERSRLLRELSERRYATFLQGQLGKTREVILERPSTRYPGIWRGHTENYLPTLSRVENGEARIAIRLIVDAVENDKVWTTALLEVPPTIPRELTGRTINLRTPD
jgi:threonylcarbamoyladenosine tRNA methylthiotransferase MtaB